MLKPIMFNTEMVRALLAGHKTVTRRAVKKFPCAKEIKIYKTACGKFYVEVNGNPTDFQLHPPYQPGDILYVRETWTTLFFVDTDGYTHYDKPMYYYAADGEPDITLIDPDGFEEDDQLIRWRPSIHMPKEAARIFLRVTDVRIERLQEIDADGVLAEGMTTGAAFCGDMEIAAQEFARLWDSTIKPTERALYGWAANPWVWVIEFDRCEKPKEEAV